MGKKIISFLLSAFLMTGCSSNIDKSVKNDSVASGEKTVNVYSARNYDVDKDIFLKFEKETGIKVNLIEGKGDELIERIKREENNNQADLFLTVGAESISYMKENNLLDKHELNNIDFVDKGFHGEDWIALTKRARIIVFDKTKNPDFKIDSYNELSNDKFNKKLLVRSGTSSYNIALTANILQKYGKEKAREFVSGVVKNLARQPKGNDRDQAKAVVAGEGEIAIMNTYYVIKMLNSADATEKETASKIGIAFPQETHVNISWGGVVKNSKNKENAKKLLEYLLKEEQQKTYMEVNGEYPVNNKIQINETLKSFGSFNQMDVDYETLGKFTVEAIMIMDELGWK